MVHMIWKWAYELLMYEKSIFVRGLLNGYFVFFKYFYSYCNESIIINIIKIERLHWSKAFPSERQPLQNWK